MKRFMICTLVIVAMLLSVSCGTATPAATTAPVDTKAPVAADTVEPSSPSTLKIYLLDYTADTIAWLKSDVNTAFEAAHPGVSVQITEGTWSGWSTTFASWFTVGSGPDIINLGSEMNSMFGDSLADMTPYLGEAAYPDIKNFGPSLENATWKGKIRGLPIFTAPRYSFCRTDLMSAGGWSAQPQNFADWVKFAKDLSKIDPITNSLTQQALVPVDAGSMADWQWWLLVYWSLGGQLYKADGVTPNFDSAEAKATTQFIADMRVATYGAATDAVGALPAGKGSVIDVNPDTGTENGAVCLEHSGWAAPALSLEGKANPVYDKISIEPFQGDKPNFPNSKPVVLAFNDWLAVAEYSQNKEMAAEWLKLAFTKEANNKWNETMGLIPSRNDAQYGYVVDNPALKKEAELAAQYGVGFAGIYDSAKLSTIMQEKLGKLVTGELSVADVLAAIQTEYTQALKDAGVL